jgi:hypothetical protein
MPAALFDLQTSSYHEYAQHSEYEFNDGLVVIPLAKKDTDPPPHFLVVRRHAPVGMRTHRVQAAKSGTPPVVPALADTPSGDRFLGATLAVEAPETRGPNSGVRTYAVAGEYRYVQGGAVDTLALTTAGQAATPNMTDRRHEPVAGALGPPVAARKVSPRLDTGRPPFARLSVDADAGWFWNLIGAIPFVGGALVRLLAGPVLDATLNRADRSVQPPNLAADFIDYAVAYRPNYMSEGIIR